MTAPQSAPDVVTCEMARKLLGEVGEGLACLVGDAPGGQSAWDDVLARLRRFVDQTAQLHEASLDEVGEYDEELDAPTPLAVRLYEALEPR